MVSGDHVFFGGGGTISLSNAGVALKDFFFNFFEERAITPSNVHMVMSKNQ